MSSKGQKIFIWFLEDISKRVVKNISFVKIALQVAFKQYPVQ